VDVEAKHIFGYADDVARMAIGPGTGRGHGGAPRSAGRMSSLYIAVRQQAIFDRPVKRRASGVPRTS